ncbi:MAG: hypothetical protein H7Z14_15035 [Anaerolineae bacterium]|nr:hypothetical protein [Phycisphaerae bacterium]
MLSKSCALAVLSSASMFVSTTTGQLVRSGSGTDPAAIQAVVDLYRTDLGALNPNTAGSFANGRREINWDGVPDSAAAPNDLPANFFNVNSPRGAVFSTPGTSVRVSADDSNPTSTPVRFGDINPTYVSTFKTFSAQRLFSPIGSNIVDMFFFVPGSATPALSRGFGAVYTDVDTVQNTSFEYFDVNGASLGTFNTPVSDNGLSFLGVSFPTAVVAHVRIRYGNSALGPNDAPGVDVAVMDDFIYGEPQAVPEPAMVGLASLVLPLLGRRARKH